MGNGVGGSEESFFLTENDFFFTEGSEESSRALSVARIIPFFLWSGIILTPTACEYIRQPSYLAFQKKKPMMFRTTTSDYKYKNFSLTI